MKRRNLTPKQNSENIKFVFNGFNSVIFRESSPVDEFYFEKCQPTDDCTESVSVVDPIIILFNQQRIENMGSHAAQSFLDSLAQKSDALSELRSKCSDEQLFSMIKSRHLQSPSEILAWSRYINQHVEEFNNELKAIVKQSSEEKESKQSSNSSNES